jgi:hypothetical protein
VVVDLDVCTQRDNVVLYYTNKISTMHGSEVWVKCMCIRRIRALGPDNDDLSVINLFIGRSVVMCTRCFER